MTPLYEEHKEEFGRVGAGVIITLILPAGVPLPAECPSSSMRLRAAPPTFAKNMRNSGSVMRLSPSGWKSRKMLRSSASPRVPPPCRFAKS